MAKQIVDPWLLDAEGNPDPFAGTVDFGMTKADEIDPDLALETHEGLQPDIVIGPSAIEPPAPEETPAPVSPVFPAEPADEGPEVIPLEDGAFISLEKEKGQWKATLDPGTGANAEVFWGKNKNELVKNVLVGKLNATKKIRDLNKQVKRARTEQATKPVQQAPIPSTVRDLTADESFEIKTLLESNPALALDTLFQKRVGLTMQQLVDLAQKGAQANMSLETEAISREFLQRNPEYYPDPENYNFSELVKWLAKFKLNKIATDSNSGEIFQELWATGNYTVLNLEEAFEDLTDDDKLVKALRVPKTSPPVEVPSAPAPQPAPAPPNPRIVNTETRPRAAAALGIRSSDLTPVAPPDTTAAPTDEDLNNLPDEEISALLRGIRRARATQARRS